jgi:hypothetical protein
MDGIAMVDAFLDTLTCGFTKNKIPFMKTLLDVGELQASYLRFVKYGYNAEEAALS